MRRIKESESGSESVCVVKEKRTRRRRIKCCENCRSSKSKCSKYPDPCTRCLMNKLECIYLPQDNEGWEEIDKGKEEHQKIDNKMAKRARREEDREDDSEVGSEIEPCPLIATDAAYEDDDRFEDNGVRIGRYNLTKRIGSGYRPKMIEEAKRDDLHRSDYDRQVFERLPKPHWLNAATEPKVPDPDDIAPSLFSHTLQISQPIHKILRSQDLADRIMEFYWERVHSVACIVHRPSFQERYDVFWYNASRGVNDTPDSTQALVYAALFAGIVSMDAEDVREKLGGQREEWVKVLEKATAMFLGRAHVIRTEKPETIQAFVMYLIPMCRSIISRTVATLVASAIDLARGMGLNKDGTFYRYDAVVTQVHRMIWHQLCFLDIRVCEAQCPRARIRKDDFTTQFPLNVDDSELEHFDLPKRGSERWTSMTLSSARMECNEKIREIYVARQLTRQGDESDSAYIKKMLEMIYEFREYMEKKYYPMIDEGIPIQHYTRLVIDLHCRRMHGMVLHEYHMSTPQGRTLPEQWSRILIKSGLETMEIAKEIETSERLRRWRWYAGALQQHSYATLMLVDGLAISRADHERRAWDSLDWIFEVPSYIPHIYKARWVAEGAVGVMKEYLKPRNLRCPTLMDERLVLSSSSPQSLTLPPLRKVTARPTKTAIPAQSRGRGASRSGQSHANSQDRALSRMAETSNMRASLQDIPMTSGAQAMHDDTKHLCTGREPIIGHLVASAPQPVRLKHFPSEEDSYIVDPPDISPDELMDTTSSGQSIVTSDPMVDRSGYSNGDNVTRPLGYRGRVRGVSETLHAASFDNTSSHGMYHPHTSWGLPQNAPYITTGNDSRHDNSSHGNSPSDSHSNSQTNNKAPHEHCPADSSSSISCDPSGFTPINQKHPMPVPPSPQHHKPPYPVGNVRLVVSPKRPPRPKGFKNVGPSDFEEPKKKPQKKRG